MPYTTDKLRKVYDIPNADPVCVNFDINQPRVAERYYFRNSKIYERNRTRQNDFQLEREFHTKDCSIKVNTPILLMDGVDTYYLGKDCEWWYGRNPVEFCYNIT